MNPSLAYFENRSSSLAVQGYYPTRLREQKEMELWREVHRGIVGRPVFARYNDQHFHPGTVHGWKSAPAGYLVLAVRFANGVVFDLSPEDIVLDPLLSTSPNVMLCFGQRVVVIHRNEKRNGFVLEHHVAADRVHIRLDFSGEIVVRRLCEICLSEDHSLLPLPPSSNMFNAGQQNVKREELGDASLMYKHEADNMRRKSVVEPTTTTKRTQDEIQTAAVVLTTLSLSPAVPNDVKTGSPKENIKFVFPPYYSPRLWTKQDNDSGDAAPVKVKSRRSKSFTATSILSKAAAAEDASLRPSSTSQLDAAPLSIDKDEGFGSSESSESIDDVPLHKTTSATKRVFRCLWKGCGLTVGSLRGIISHVRQSHLGPTIGETTEDDDEMFYFDDVEVDCAASECSSTTSDVATKDMAIGLMQSAPPSLSASPTAFGPSNDVASSDCNSTTIGEMSPPEKSTESDGSCGLLFNRAKAKRRPRSATVGATISLKVKPVKRSKSSSNEGMKKCRKIYGMENRQQWCTQCRWKKACVRFVDQ